MNRDYKKLKLREKQRLKLSLRISLVLWIALVFAVLISIIPFRLAIALYQVPQPQAIFVLGGDYARVTAAVRLTRQNPNLRIWVSDYLSRMQLYKRLFQQAGIAPENFYYDFCATDTVTNFTCTVEELVKRDLRHIYLVTSDYHMRRARIIATIVFGSKGIAVTPVIVPSIGVPEEPLLRALRDGIRAIFWIIAGRTGASLNPRLPTIN
jgi:uncharacterized SAM-binding protein YcdF (DUF218 family)